MFLKINKKMKYLTRRRYYENCVEASYSIGCIRKLFGISVFTVKSAPGGLISAQFSYLGFISCVCWYFLYCFCVFRIYSSDQTILRSLYDTKLQSYGDEVERISTAIYVTYTIWKLPFDISMDVYYMQVLVDIDKAIENLGEPINFSKFVRSTYVIAIFTIFISTARILITWLTLGFNATMPLEKVFQVVYSDAMALFTTSHYCGYLYSLKGRYNILNKILDSIEPPKTRNILVAATGRDRGRASNIRQFPDKCTSEKLRSCGKIYGMLHDATETVNTKFGLSVALTMLMCLILIVLYLFYFMEATASGLFHDIQRYFDFLIYVSWQIAFAIIVIYLNIYFCENTVHEAKLTAIVTHKIINSEINPIVRTEAVHLSLQITHQLPLFTARGLCKIDYMLLLEGARTVVTFLVILLQFAANTH